MSLNTKDLTVLNAHTKYKGNTKTAHLFYKQMLATLSKSNPKISRFIHSGVITDKNNQQLEGMFLRALLADLGRPPEATELLIDNRGVVDISHDPGAVHARSKHIHRRHFYVRELVQSGEFKTTFVPGDDNLADIFTKPLDTRKFLNLRARLMNLPMPRA